MSKYIKILLENVLGFLPSKIQNSIAIRFTKIKVKINKIKLSRLKIRLHRFCDFVIVRCNGNEFIEFELSNICNARCIFCPYPDMLKSGKKMLYMSDETLKNVKAKMLNLKGALVSFTPTTGDTLLHPEWAKSIEEIIALNTVSRATFFTNAIALDESARMLLLNLIQNDKQGKLSQIYFSIGGLSSENYEKLYAVDRFDKVMNNINSMLDLLKSNGKNIGIHIHVKLLKNEQWNVEKANVLFNAVDYNYVYFSKSTHYFSNDKFKKNVLIDYYPEPVDQQKKACAYLNKTRFAADGGVWADGCVISELPNDSSLKLGNVQDKWSDIESNRKILIKDWEIHKKIPEPCQSCSMYRA